MPNSEFISGYLKKNLKTIYLQNPSIKEINIIISSNDDQFYQATVAVSLKNATKKFSLSSKTYQSVMDILLGQIEDINQDYISDPERVFPEKLKKVDL